MRAMQPDLFEGAATVAVSQKKEWLEILTDIENRNRFTIDFDGRDGVLLASEEGGGWKRFLLGSMRPYTLLIQTREKKPVLRMHAPFRWIHREITVMDATGKPLGTVRKRFTIPHTRYDVFDTRGGRIFEIARGFVKAWTFTIRRDGQDVAVISKRWSGLGREVFTDADRFQLHFPGISDPTERKILLGALFLIDFAHFEKGGD
jgi:uncharacterized protein YxjI